MGDAKLPNTPFPAAAGCCGRGEEDAAGLLANRAMMESLDILPSSFGACGVEVALEVCAKKSFSSLLCPLLLVAAEGTLLAAGEAAGVTDEAGGGAETKTRRGSAPDSRWASRWRPTSVSPARAHGSRRTSHCSGSTRASA